MCGIAGIYTSYSSGLFPVLKKMTDSLVHRGPDGEGFWIDEDEGIALGHRRLAIIDLSDAGKQPMTYQNKFTITFNGEIYNYLEIRKTLNEFGYKFYTDSDTEVILAAYDLWGPECLQRFDGMFAFALYDIEKKLLFCARDRFGEKPFFYSLSSQKFVFASEMKALWKADVSNSVNNRLLYLFLTYGLHDDPCEPSHTFFNEIFRLKPAHYIIYKKNVPPEQICYWKINPEKVDKTITFDEACNKFRELFITSVTRRLRSDVPVGTSLSGGLDSSSVVCTIDLLKQSDEVQKTFSARFQDPLLDEGKFMADVVKNKNIAHHCTWPDEVKMTESLEKIMFHQEEPFATSSIYAQWEVFALAKKENTTVLLDGQGADEYLSGYTHFLAPFLRELYTNRGLGAFKNERNKILKNNPPHEVPDAGFMFMAESVFPGLYRASRKTKSILLGNKDFQFTAPELNKPFRNSFPPFPIFNNLNSALHYATFHSGLEKLLRFADRNSMAHSREVRLPFLYHELVEFVFLLPSHYKIYNGWTKGLLRYSMQKNLPESITWRKNKLGFQAPQHTWEKSKIWNEWSGEFHLQAIKNKRINKDSPITWKTVNAGLFEYVLQKH